MKQKNNIKILVVEDDYLVAARIVDTLNELGFKYIIEASNGVEAVDTACRKKPDIIIMDLEMPKMGGIEASSIIQEKCTTPIIILTAYDTPNLIDEASKAGVSAYLIKPLKKELVKKAITIALARHKDLMEVRRLNNELENKK